MNELLELVWSYASIYDFWSIFLAMVKTSETPWENLARSKITSKVSS